VEEQGGEGRVEVKEAIPDAALSASGIFLMAPMPTLEHEGQKITIDEDGFLARLEDRTEAVARSLAAQEGIADLSEDQLDILKFLRTCYLKHKFFPIVRYVCKNVRQPWRSPVRVLRLHWSALPRAAATRREARSPYWT
jgi:TusE/DsrC/DsvC family sulfur relay protein